MDVISDEKLQEIEKAQMSRDPEENKKIYTKENPHVTGAYWSDEEQKWRGYKAVKGVSPPWVPYSQKRIRTEPNLREKKFMWILSKTGSIYEASKSTYKVKHYEDKRIEAARLVTKGKQVLTRLKRTFPDFVKAFSFSDFGPDFIRNNYLELLQNPNATIGERKGVLDSMAKLEQLFSEKKIVDVRIREVINPVYKETDSDMPDNDNRLSKIALELAAESTQDQDESQS